MVESVMKVTPFFWMILEIMLPIYIVRGSSEPRTNLSSLLVLLVDDPSGIVSTTTNSINTIIRRSLRDRLNTMI